MKKTAFPFLLALLVPWPQFAQPATVPSELAFQAVEWSPDGKGLLFSTIYRKADWSDYSPENWKLLLYDLSSKQTSLVAEAVAFACFSPDGKQVAYGKTTGEKGLFLQNLLTGEERRITFGDDRAPSWSPDGARLAFNSDRTGTTEIFSVNIDGSNLRQITKSGEHKSYNPQWSPTGNQIVYYFEKGDRRDQVWLTDSDGSFFKNLTADTLNNCFPGWATGGIVYASADERIFRIKSDGTGRQELGNVRSFFARVSPDGKCLAYFDKIERALVVQRHPSGKKRELVFSEQEYLSLE